MQAKTLKLLILMFFVPFLLKAEWVTLNKSKTNSNSPNVTLLSDDANHTDLKIEISGFDLNTFVSEDKTYQSVDLLNESFTIEPGSPELPYISKTLAIPDQASVSVEILEMSTMLTFDSIYLAPARESWIEGNPETPYSEDLKIYGSSNTYPQELVSLEKPAVFRDFRILRVSVYPLRYLPAKKQLQAVTSITVRIHYDNGKTAINPKTSSKKQISPAFGQLYRSFIFNYQSALDKSFGGKEEGHELMLCIIPDDFYESFLPYADWKRKSGVDIHITKFSDIGANSSNTGIIKDHISDAYYNWEIPPTYVLLIGDGGVCPVYSGGNENYFVEIEGNDYFPDMMIGRFTNQSDYGMQVMTNKFLMYEQTPYTTTSHWFKKGICCSNDAYTSQIETKRFAASRMMEFGNFLSVDTMMSDPGCTYNNTDVKNAINEGRSFLNYRGEGWSSGWWATCTPLHISDLSNLDNGQKLPFVTSIGCGVAMFDSGHCFGEEWVEMGTISNPRGAVAFMGPSGSTHTTYNNKIDKGIYVGMFEEGMDTPGQAQVRGKIYMYNVFGNTGYVEDHFKKYLIIGDPSIHIWKDVPQNVTVDYPPSVPFGATTVEFTITHTSTGLPVSNAVVCITGDTLFTTGFTDELGKAYVDVEATKIETFNVTVRGGTVYPFQGIMLVAPPVGPYVVHQSTVLNDEASNNNGLMETGESILASLTIENIGVADGENINVTIQTTDEFINITDDTEYYGVVSANSTATVIDGFAWDVADNIPDLHTVNFEVNATNGIDTWTSFFEVIGYAPDLNIGKMIIHDSEMGNGNGRLDAGETVDLYIETYNDGSFEALNSIGEIITLNPFITLTNTTHDFGSIQNGVMEEAIFTLAVDVNAPIGESVEFTYNVNSGGYFAEKLFFTKIGIILEDWEGGDMNQFEWETGGSNVWFVTDDDPYEGIYCAKSGTISDDQNSWLSLDYEVLNPDTISFYYKVSSESNYDYLRFYIDNYQMGQWSGQVEWQKASYPVTPGNYTFKWEYNKDFSISSGSDCAWIDYIVLPTSALSAYFTADNMEPCMNEEVQFNDISAGPPTAWEWTFEGGNPVNSNEQNPIVVYNSEGSFDVSLTVYNGSENSSLTLEDYITVQTLPGTPEIPGGPELVCALENNTFYTTTGLPGVSTYNWLLEPENAGSISITGLAAIVMWTDGYQGEATLQVAGENSCGVGPYSDALTIIRYLPEVSLDPFDWVCLDWPAFQLSGGMPEGGTYSGPGVAEGWFDPAVAGLGTHTITYTYEDPNDCVNFAEQTILVDPCTGINEINEESDIVVYPNPGKGIFSIRIIENQELENLQIYNSHNQLVFEKNNISSTEQSNYKIDLSHLPSGIYYLTAVGPNSNYVRKIILQE